MAAPLPVYLVHGNDWSLPVSRAAAAQTPESVRIHGGASVPKHPAPCDAFLRAESHVDVAVRGEGEVTAAELLAHLVRARRSGAPWRAGLDEVAGLSHLAPEGGVMIRSADRPSV